MNNFTRNKDPKKSLRLGENCLLDDVTLIIINFYEEKSRGSEETIEEILDLAKGRKDPYGEILRIIMYNFRKYLIKHPLKNIKVKLGLKFLNEEYQRIDAEDEIKIISILSKLKNEYVREKFGS